jgi:hypothetical protein
MPVATMRTTTESKTFRVMIEASALINFWDSLGGFSTRYT